MPLLATTDTFGLVLAQLDKTFKDFGPLVTPIDDVTNIVTDIDGLLVSIGDLISAADDIDDVIIVLGDVLDFLDPIPVIGEVAGLISATVETVGETLKDALTTAKEINTETIQPVANVLSDVRTGLTDIRTVVVDISQKVPGYINTVEILHYLSEIAEPLTSVLKDSDAADKLNKLLATFNDVQQDIGKALDDMRPVISAADTGVKDLTKVLNNIHNAMGDGVTNVLNDIKSAAAHLTPISHAFHRVEEAIKPLAWVLDALSWIFDKILQPVINTILDATGLKGLIDKAENEIFKKLGIAPIMDMAKSNVNKSGVAAAGSSTGTEQGMNTKRLWNTVDTALGQYRSGKDGGTKAAIRGLVSAITNTPIDPGAASKPPPFPVNIPSIIPATTNDNNSSTSLKAFFVPRKISSINTDVITRLKNPPVRVYSRSLVALKALRDDPALPPLPPVDPRTWPNATALINSIAAFTPSLDTLAPAAAKLEGSLQQFKASLSLPATFALQVTDLSQLLTDTVNILDFFESLNIGFVNALVKPFDDIAHDQNTKMNTVVNTLPALQTTMSTLEAASEKVITSVPQTKPIDQAIHRVEGWSLGVNQIVQVVEEFRTEDAKKGSKQKAQIDAFAQKVEEISSTVSAKVQRMDAEAKTLATAVGALQAGLDTYASELEKISAHSTLIASNALPVANQAVHILGIVNSIIDPLSGLLLAENCVDASSPMKLYAAAGKDAINLAGKAAATKQPKAFVEFAEKLAESALPLTQMADAIQSVSTSISAKTVGAFANQSDNLISGLTNLGKELVQTECYTTTITGRDGKTITITVNNDLFNQDLLTEANQIVSALT